jgi:exopolysaccharide biosynthesis polyprenyl glycosylphosphotransferase
MGTDSWFVDLGETWKRNRWLPPRALLRTGREAAGIDGERQLSTLQDLVGNAAPLTALDAEAALPSDRLGRARRGPRRTQLLIVGGWLLPVLDLAALAGAFACAVLLTGDSAGRLALSTFPLLGVVVLAARGAYAPRLRLIVLDSLGLAAGSISVAAMSALAVGLLVDSADPGSGLLFRAWLLGIGFVGVVRLLFALWQHRLRIAGVAARRTVIVGGGEVGARVGRRLASSPAYGLMPIGYVDDDPPSAAEVGGRPVPILGSSSDLLEIVEANRVEHVVVAFSHATDHQILPLLRRCAAQGVGVSLVPRLFDLINNRSAYEPVGGLPVSTLRSTNPLGATFALKHAIDRVVAVLLIVILAPLLAFIAALVKRSSPGPVLFRQRRIGRDNRPFDVMKFRTMTHAEPASGFVLPQGSAPGGVEGVDRRTRVGRWLRRTSLDELPQLFNVARGEMSLVGPRPERPDYVQMFAADLARYAERHRVRAGITGLSQVHGLRGQCPIADRVELDNYYIENWSLFLDLKILLMTLLAVIRPVE